MTTTYGTLSVLAVFPVTVDLVRRGASSERVRGNVKSRTLRENVSRQTGKPETRVWRLTFGPESESSLLASFDAAKAAALPLSWTPPPPDDSGGAIPVRFVEDSLVIRRGPGPVYSSEVMLEEVP